MRESDAEVEDRFRTLFANMTHEQRRGAYRLTSSLVSIRSCNSRLKGLLLEWILDADSVPDFRAARGAIPLEPGMPTAAEAIRRARDGEGP